MLAIVAEAQAGLSTMLVRMIGDYMAFMIGAHHQVGMPLDVHPYTEECRFDIQLSHGVEQTFCTWLAWPIIECDRDFALIARTVIMEIAKAAIRRTKHQRARRIYSCYSQPLWIDLHDLQRLLSI